MYKELHNEIVGLFLEFKSAVIVAKTTDDGNSFYTDNDFTFNHFIDWLIENNP